MSATNKKQESRERRQRRPHDQFALFMLQDPEWAKRFFQRIMPPELVRLIDWSTFQRLNDNDTDDNLKKTVTDVAYKVVLNGKFVLYLLFVVEHRSSVPKKHLPIQFQLARYALAKLVDFFKDFEKDLLKDVEKNEASEEEVKRDSGKEAAVEELFPLPVLLVLYNGPEKWHVLTLKDYYRQAGAPEVLIDLVLEVPYTLYDLSSKTQEELNEVFGDTPELRAMLQSLKAIWTVDQEPELLNDILKDEEQLQNRVIQAILNYLRTAFEDKKAFETVLQATKGGDMIRVYNQDHLESEARGERKRNVEVAKLMLKDKEDIGKILRYTTLSLEELEAIRAKLQ